MSRTFPNLPVFTTAAFLLVVVCWVSISAATDDNDGKLENKEEKAGVSLAVEQPAGTRPDDGGNGVDGRKRRSLTTLTHWRPASADSGKRAGTGSKMLFLGAALVAGLVFTLSRLGGAFWECLAELGAPRPSVGTTSRSLSEQSGSGGACDRLLGGLSEKGGSGTGGALNLGPGGPGPLSHLALAVVVLMVLVAVSMAAPPKQGLSEQTQPTEEDMLDGVDYSEYSDGEWQEGSGSGEEDDEDLQRPAAPGERGVRGQTQVSTEETLDGEDYDDYSEGNSQEESGTAEDGEEEDSGPLPEVEDTGKIIYVGRKWHDAEGRSKTAVHSFMRFDFEDKIFGVYMSRQAEDFLDDEERALVDVESLWSHPPVWEGEGRKRTLVWGKRGSATLFESARHNRINYEIYLPPNALTHDKASGYDQAYEDLYNVSTVLMEFIIDKFGRKPQGETSR